MIVGRAFGDAHWIRDCCIWISVVPLHSAWKESLDMISSLGNWAAKSMERCFGKAFLA